MTRAPRGAEMDDLVAAGVSLVQNLLHLLDFDRLCGARRWLRTDPGSGGRVRISRIQQPSQHKNAGNLTQPSKYLAFVCRLRPRALHASIP